MYAMYLRKSRADNPHESIEETLRKHEKILFDLANKLNIKRSEIVQFKEVVSGEDLKNRPEAQKMLKLVMENAFEGVLVVDSQRLARGDTLDQGTIIRAFSLNNTKIITPGKTINPGDEIDQDYFEFDLFMGRREYKMINKRMQRGRSISVQEGNYIGSIAPYGYRKTKIGKCHTLEINEDEIVCFNKMKELALNGLGCTNVANELNRLGFKSRKSKLWTTNAVRDILLNKTNLGFIKWNTRKSVKIYKNDEIIKSRPRNEEAEYYPGKHPAIITQVEYDAIVENIKNRARPVKKDKKLQNPLAGIVYCGKCGKAMIRRSYNNGYRDGLICTNTHCNNVSSVLEVVEKRVLESLEDTLKEYRQFIDNYHNDKTKTNNDSLIIKTEKEINKIDSQINKACEMLEVGAYSVELFKERKTLLDNQKKALIDKIEALKKEDTDFKLQNYINAVPILENAIKLYWNSSVEEKNKLLKQIVKRCDYLKSERGKRNGKGMYNFKLNIYLKI